MTRKPILLLLLIVLSASLSAAPAQAQSAIRVADSRAELDFPNSARFSAEVQSGSEITEVVLEYGTNAITCGSVVAKAFPIFSPAASVEVEWTWEMLQSGSLPPGARIWWRWQATDSSGATYESPVQEITWLDSLHDWQTISGGNVNLHYYEGGQSFGQELHEAATAALARLVRDVGITVERPADLYIYADTQDMQDAILYEPSWTGGQAFPDYDIVIIGINPDILEWGKRTEAHELTHVLVGHLTFSCLGFVPTWLNEGLAMYGEGGLEDYQQSLFDQAVASDAFPTLRSLGGGFSEESERANLSYSMSFSVVDFMIQEHGRQKMTALLQELKAGATADEALKAVYGLDVDELDAAWRASIGAPPRSGGAEPTPMPTPTSVPTIMPISGMPASPPTPIVRPTPAGVAPTQDSPPATAAPVPSLAERWGLSSEVLLYFGVGLLCVVLGLALILGPVLVTVRKRHNRREP
jgi:hypothetical protein